MCITTANVDQLCLEDDDHIEWDWFVFLCSFFCINEHLKVILGAFMDMEMGLCGSKHVLETVEAAYLRL